MSEDIQQDHTATAGEVKLLPPAPWSGPKRFGFRVLFIFLLAMCIPFSSNWYKNLFMLDWTRPHYRDLYDIARFQPAFVSLFSGKRDRDIPMRRQQRGVRTGNVKQRFMKVLNTLKRMSRQAGMA